MGELYFHLYLVEQSLRDQCANELFWKRRLFGKAKEENKAGKKLARPVSLLLTIILAVGVVVLVMFGVIPQLTRTIASLIDKYC